ncbi:MAG: hypothetical protein NVS2B3_02370 [Vulcanimicrobiaceae bacterium]
MAVLNSADDARTIAGVSWVRPELYWSVDRSLRIVSIAGGRSPLFDELARAATGRSLAETFAVFDPGDVGSAAHRRALGGHVVPYELTCGAREYRCVARPAYDARGEIVGVSGLASDATGEIDLSRALRRAEETLTLAQETAHVGSWTRDGHEAIVAWSPELFRLCGLAVGSVVPTMDLLVRHVHREDRLAFEVALDIACEELTTYALDARLIRADGAERWVHHRGSASLDPSGSVRIIGTVLDIESRRAAEARLVRRAHYDDATGLPNRKLLMDRLEQFVIATQHTHATLAVLFVDLDRYKSVCETLGHATGEAFLAAIAPRLSAAAGEGRTTARCGADEFAIVLSDVGSVDEAARVAERIVEVFATAVTIDGLDIYSTASVGIAVFPDDGESADELMRSAAAAQQSARVAGQSSFRFYAQATHVMAIEHLDFEHRLRRAVETNVMELHYQPIVDRFERPVAVEALLRWTDDRFGAIAPDRFITLCEELGLIAPLGRWIVREAVAQLGRWDAAGLPEMRLALNISGRQLLDPTLIATLSEALASSGVAAERIELEITESVIMDDVRMARSAIAAFKTLGLRVALDDFGTGYSSLSYLKHFRVDTLKVDRAFVTDLPYDRGDAAIVSAVVALGHAMGFGVVAEGVETAEQAALVRKLGCDELQGWYFSKALPAEELERVVRAWSRAS